MVDLKAPFPWFGGKSRAAHLVWDAPTPTVTQGLTGVFLDPPYADTAGRDAAIYAEEDLAVAHAVREWALAHGDDPQIRIVLCGYNGEHVMPPSWTEVPWKTHGGYAHIGHGRGKHNATRERLWLSPHCLRSPALPFDSTDGERL